jgi:hypothetical protein
MSTPTSSAPKLKDSDWFSMGAIAFGLLAGASWLGGFSDGGLVAGVSGTAAGILAALSQYLQSKGF